MTALTSVHGSTDTDPFSFCLPAEQDTKGPRNQGVVEEHMGGHVVRCRSAGRGCRRRWHRGRSRCLDDVFFLRLSPTIMDRTLVERGSWGRVCGCGGRRRETMRAGGRGRSVGRTCTPFTAVSGVWSLDPVSIDGRAPGLASLGIPLEAS